MTIVDQAIMLPQLRELKDCLLSSALTRPHIEKREPVSYLKELNVIVEDYMETCFHGAVDVILTLWRLFPEELTPLYALVDIDADWVDGRMVRVIWEAKQRMKNAQRDCLFR